MIRYLLDTNVVSQAGKAKPNANVVAWLATVDDTELAISVVTIHEITYGVERARLAGHAAAAALSAAAAALEGLLPDDLERVGIVLSGGNVDPPALAKLLGEG